MWKKPELKQPIEPEQLVIGLYIELAVGWSDHPFVSNRFKIVNDNQIATIRALNVAGKLFYYPNKSDKVPATLVKEHHAAPCEVDSNIVNEIEQQKKEKQARLQSLKDAAVRADRAWEQAARATKEALVGMDRSPKQAGLQLRELSIRTASEIAKGEEILLHLLGDQAGEGPHYHALNTMTLGMLIGKEAGLKEDLLSELALGLLAHDIGKTRVPRHLLHAKSRAKHEEEFYRAHVHYGIDMARVSGAFSPSSLSVIGDHHELLDGSGWPRGITNPSGLARIAALVDRYDRLCSPEAHDVTPLMPAEALGRIFKTESARFDPFLLKTLIRLLGVYPPGTIVELSDDTLGLVVSPGLHSLRPTVVIYNPDIARQEAPVLDLGENDIVRIATSVHPNKLPKDVVDWLQPRKRLSYFYSVEKKAP